MRGDQPTEKQKHFAIAYVRNGGNGTNAAKEAGYIGTRPDQSAHQALSSSIVQNLIRIEAVNLLNANVAIGARVLVDLAQTSKSDSVKLQAAQSLLDRGGLPFIRQTEHKHTLEDHRTDAELKAHIKKLTDELGLNAKVIEQAPVTGPVAAEKG
jgi:hypothetical protein